MCYVLSTCTRLISPLLYNKFDLIWMLYRPNCLVVCIISTTGCIAINILSYLILSYLINSLQQHDQYRTLAKPKSGVARHKEWNAGPGNERPMRDQIDRHNWKMRDRISMVGKCRTGKCKNAFLFPHFPVLDFPVPHFQRPFANHHRLLLYAKRQHTKTRNT